MRDTRTYTLDMPPAGAIKYTISMTNFIKLNTENWEFLIDSHPVEREQRPSVLGHKNKLLSLKDCSAEQIFNTIMLSC